MTTTSQDFPALAALAAILRNVDPNPQQRLGAPPTLEAVRQRREEIVALAGQFGAQDVRVIGSVARGTATPDSDIDFLVTLAPDRTLLDLGGLQEALVDLLACPVHVVSDGHVASVSPTSTPRDDREDRPLARLRADAVPV